MASELVGRDPEIAAVESLLAGIGDGGGALLMLGDPGIGKSALAEMASRRAADRGMRVLTCAGVPGEAHLSFAGLHQLLRPVLAEADGLARGQRTALLTALGAGEGVARPCRWSGWRPWSSWRPEPGGRRSWLSPRTCTGWTPPRARCWRL